RLQRAAVSAVVAGPADTGVPGMLSKASRQRLLSRWHRQTTEARPPGGGTTTSVGGSCDGGAQAQPQPVAFADVRINAAASAQESAAQVVARRDGRRQQHDAVEAVGWKAFRGSQNDGAAGAVTDQGDADAGSLVQATADLGGE